MNPLLAKLPAIPMPLTPDGMIDADDFPSWAELTHWSLRLSHAAMVAGIAIGVALVLHWLLFALLRRIVRRGKDSAASEVVAVRQFKQAVRWGMVAIAVAFAGAVSPLLRHLWAALAFVMVPALLGWVGLALVRTVAEVLDHRTDAKEDWIAARSRRTRIALLSRTVTALVVVVTVAMVLLGIPEVRRVGVTLIASAGLMTLAVGAAAQPALKSLIAGLQIALTQPLRIGDMVQVDGDSGRVEDIGFTYVVIRNGEERRLVVPTTKFLETTFQNWTRVAGITGHVLLPLRAGVALTPVREAFLKLLGGDDRWDQRTGTLAVSEVHPGWVELSLTMSATGPDDLAGLRTAMREGMLEWLRTDYAEGLVVEAVGAVKPL